VAMKKSGTWGRVLESDGAPDLQATRVGTSGADWAVFCVVESSFLRSFQRQQMCRDRSSVAREPRVAASSFGKESASWQRRQPDF
jgi:hypothetical protein